MCGTGVFCCELTHSSNLNESYTSGVRRLGTEGKASISVFLFLSLKQNIAGKNR